MWVLLLVGLGLSGPAAVAAGVPGFDVFCFYSHTLPDDPIVYPGRPGASHAHQFYGNTGTDAGSTPSSLRTGKTNCLLSADKAAYWSPALYSSGVEQHATRLHLYYRAGALNDLASIAPLPSGAGMIAGNHDATSPQPTSVVGWSCGGRGESLASTPKDCRGSGNGMRGADIEVLHYFFPNCLRAGFAGTRPTSYTYSYHGSCPNGYRPVVRLTEDIAYPAKDPKTYTLAGKDAAGHNVSTASVYTAHADFMNGWTQTVLAKLVRDCVNAGRQCGLVQDGKTLP
jgi:hypothetical protein